MLTNLELLKYPRWWRYGMPRIDVWVRQADLIANWIKEFKLKPVAKDDLIHFANTGIDFEAPMRKAATMKEFDPRPIPFPGGLRIPHFHHKGELYVMNEKQWATVSKGLITEMRAKLDAVNTVSFEQVMDLSDVMNGF